MDQELRDALAELLAMLKAQGVQADAVQALALSLLLEHPHPERVAQRFEAFVRAAEGEHLHDTGRTDDQIELALAGWQHVRRLVLDAAASRATELEPPSEPKRR